MYVGERESEHMCVLVHICCSGSEDSIQVGRWKLAGVDGNKRIHVRKCMNM